MTEIFKNNQIPDKTWQEIVQPSLGGTENEGVSTSGGGQQYYYPEIYGGIFYGSSFKTNDSGARLEIFPQYDPTIGMIVYDNADVEVFKIIIDGINVGDVIMGNYTGGQGAMWDKSAGTFSVAGAFTAGSIAIGTSPNWFKVDTSGNIWSGNATLAGAQTNTFAVLNTGILYCKAANINGSVIDGTSTIGGRVSSTLASAIDASGHFADAAINTATSTILGAFTFGVSGALQIGTYVNGVSGDIRISPTGILGRDKDNNTTFSINATTGIAVLNGLVVGTNVGLGTAQDSSGVTTIIGNTVTTGFVNALNITAVNLNAATGTFSGSLTVGTALDTVVSNSFPSDVNLVGYWAFDEGTGSIAYDNSGNSNNATLVNTPTWITGVVGKGLTFASASSQYGTITALGNKFGSGTMTICFQLKTDTSSSVRQRIVSSATYMSAFFGDTGNSGSDMYFYLYNGGWTSGAPCLESYILRDNIWHFYTITINGTLVSGYRDGVLIDTYNGDKSLAANMTNVLYPVCGTTPNEYLNGSFDELRIYSTILTAAQVYALYKYPSGIPAYTFSPGRLTSGQISSKQIVLGTWVSATDPLDTYIASGKHDFDNTDSGFILGIDNTDSLAKFYIGSSTKYLNLEPANNVANYKGDLSVDAIFYNKRYLYTCFDSLDGWTQELGASGAITLEWGELSLDSGANATSYAAISCKTSNYDTTVDFSKSPYFQTRLKTVSLTNQTIFIYNGTRAANCFGFSIINGALYALWYKASSGHTSGDIVGGTTLTQFNNFRAVYTYGSKIDFYVNGTLVYTATTNLPLVNSSTERFIFRIYGPNAGENKEMYIQYLLLGQDE